MDVIHECQMAAQHKSAISLNVAEELMQLEQQIAYAKKEVMRNCPLMKVSVLVAGEEPKDYHLNAFEVAKLKMGIDHQQWRTDYNHR
jgi:hypothetical protein